VSNRQIALIKLLEEDPGEDAGAGNVSTASVLDSVPLGTYDEVVESFSHFNTAPDGSNESMGVLFGPGFTVQLPFVGRDDPVMQVLISIDEDESAWPVLTRICKNYDWKMLDPSTGRTFG